jgi:hypothetical protein
MIVGTLVLATWVFLRAQGVETWEASRPQKWIIALAIAVIMLLPVTIADTNYDVPRPAGTAAPAIQGLFARLGSSLALTDPGGQMGERCCSTILNRDDWPLSSDQPQRRDLLLLLPVESTQHVSSLHIQVMGESGLNVSADPEALNPAEDALETRVYTNDLGPASAEGHHVAKGWVARVPVTLIPTKPWDIGGDRYPLRVTASYVVEGDIMPHSFSARAAVNAQVGSAIYEMGAASLIFPLACFGAAFRRWKATR